MLRSWNSSIWGDSSNQQGALVTQFDISDTPEPATFALAGSALCGLALLQRKRAQ